MLKEYKRKRDFKITPEPSGDIATAKAKTKAKGSLTFVIQKHDATRLHYDFRLEVDGVMVSWAVPKGPSLNPADKRLAVMTEDHPMEYSSFEGIIPEHQYGAGEVIIWDQGTYSPDKDGKLSWDDKEDANKRMREDLKKGRLSFYLKGEKVEGSWALVKLGNKEKDWLLIKHHDKFENSETDITAQDQSVVSGKTLADLQEQGADRIWTRKGEQAADPKTTGKSWKTPKGKQAFSQTSVKKSPISRTSKGVRVKSGVKKKAECDALIEGGKQTAFPKVLSPMLATLADQPFSLDGWFFEPKLDGIRAIATIRNGKVTLSSRRGLDLTGTYPTIVQSLSGYDNDLVLDGEIVALDEEGRPSFQHLQQGGGGRNSFSARNKVDMKSVLRFYVFDILFANGRSLVDLPLVVRKQVLEGVLQPNETVKYVQSLGTDGETAFQVCADNGLEGVVGKQSESQYEVGRRSRSWLKVKTNNTAEFLICGYTEGTGSRFKTFGSLILGEYDSAGELQFVGGVGTGLSDKKLESLLSKMTPLKTVACPFATKPRGKLNPQWVEPKLVAEIKFMERTQDHQLRAPVFMHLREDIEPQDVRTSQVIRVKSNKKTSTSSGTTKSRPKSVSSIGTKGSAIDKIASTKTECGAASKVASEIKSSRGATSQSTVKQAPKTSQTTTVASSHFLESSASSTIRRVETSQQAMSRPKKLKVAEKFPTEVQSVLNQLAGAKEKVVLELNDCALPVTSLDKVYWPANADKAPITKRDYLSYLAKVSAYVLPHLEDRLLTLRRFPNGIAGNRFYQKHWEQKLAPFIKSVTVYTEGERKDQDFLVCNNLPTLLWLGQIADLEIHTSHTRVTSKPDARNLSENMAGSVANVESGIGNYPDFLVLDLDPYLYSGKEKKGEEPELHEEGFEMARVTARYLKDHLNALRMPSYIKTTGKTGLHIFVPIVRNVDYDSVRAVAQVLCGQILKEHPKELTMEWSVSNRTGKVFLDHNMNARSKSLASIYSPRVSPEAFVSFPVSWDQLDQVHPSDFDMNTVPEFLLAGGDPWKDILDHRFDLQAFSGDSGTRRRKRRA